jgi:hypothetical protein
MFIESNERDDGDVQGRSIIDDDYFEPEAKAPVIEETDPEGTEAKEEDKESYSRRVQKRLDKLVYERNVERQRAEQLQNDMQAMRDRVEELSKQRELDIEQRNTQSLDQQRQDLFERRKIALELANYDELNEIDEQLMDIKLKGNARAPEKPVNVPKQGQETPQAYTAPVAQQAWEQKNQWLYDPQQSSRKEKANKIFQDLLNDGYDIEDPETFEVLDKKLKRDVPPPPGAVDRGNVTANDNSGGITAEEKQRMIRLKLDPSDPQTRIEWIKNHRKGN